MKLSALERLVARMRVVADSVGNTDPNVEFYLHGQVDCNPFANCEPEPNAADEITQHVVIRDGNKAKRGDFAIPLQNC